MSPLGPAEPIRVVCAVEREAYVRHGAAMLHSLLAVHPPGGVRIEYLHGDDTSARGRTQLAEMVDGMGGEIAYHRVPDEWVTGLPIKGFTRKATWYRIFLTRLLPDAERAIYLDLDLVVRASLVPLWETDLGTNLIGAVTNVPPGPERDVVRPELGGDPYFNAGVLLLDLQRMRSEGTDESLRRYAVANAARLALRDQDALNYVLHDRRLALHPRWNCMNSIVSWDYAREYFSEEQIAQARRDPAIRHFEGPTVNKPWHVLADPAAQLEYLAHRRLTPWPKVRRSGVTPVNMLRYARRRLIYSRRGRELASPPPAL